jgi:hypothetical protein
MGGCKISSQKPPKIENAVLDYKTDSLVVWSLLSSDNKNSIVLTEVRKRYGIENGRLYDKKQKNTVSGLTIQMKKNDHNAEDVYISNGLPIYAYYEKNHNNMDWRLINYDVKGNLDGVFVVGNYQTHFMNGSGDWKNYYFKEYKNPNDTVFEILEEGKVKNNFKVGVWKYYNKDGKIEKTKTYTLKDAVDVRFPFCIFNKNEPCY